MGHLYHGYMEIMESHKNPMVPVTTNQKNAKQMLILMPTSHWPNGMGKPISMAFIDKPTPVRKVQLYQLAAWAITASKPPTRL